MSNAIDWTDEMVDDVVRQYESGLSCSKIGDRYCCSWMTIERRLKERGVQLRKGGNYNSSISDAQILELHEHGLSDYEIADELGVSRYVVNYRIHKVVGPRGKGKSFSRERVCLRCGKRFETMVKNQEFCSTTCRNAAHWQKRDDEKRVNTDGSVEEITLREIYDRDNGRCYICGERTDWNDYRIVNGFKVCGPRYPSRDHVIALHNGGTNTRDNIRLACWECNTLKSDKGQMRLAI
jgi:5-methylcytosine-specific restriction endonuclease McrA